MRCPTCDVQNPNDAAKCSSCGQTLSRRQRRRGPTAETDAPCSPAAERCNAAALRAYRLCLIGFVPGPGLLLGPLCMLLGAMARLRGNSVPGFSGRTYSTAAFVFGALISATQWIGVTLMLIGWGGKR
jgi:hypothetical protein